MTKTIAEARLARMKEAFSNAGAPRNYTEVPAREAKRLRDLGIAVSWEDWIYDLRMRAALAAARPTQEEHWTALRYASERLAGVKAGGGTKAWPESVLMVSTSVHNYLAALGGGP